MEVKSVKVPLMSLNVAGLNNPLKRRSLRLLIKNKNGDTFYCQETYLRKMDARYLKEVYSGVIFYAPASVKNMGVFRGLSKKLNYKNRLLYLILLYLIMGHIQSIY